MRVWNTSCGDKWGKRRQVSVGLQKRGAKRRSTDGWLPVARSNRIWRENGGAAYLNVNVLLGRGLKERNAPVSGCFLTNARFDFSLVLQVALVANENHGYL